MAQFEVGEYCSGAACKPLAVLLREKKAKPLADGRHWAQADWIMLLSACQSGAVRGKQSGE